MAQGAKKPTNASVLRDPRGKGKGACLAMREFSTGR